MLEERTFEIVWVDKDDPVELDFGDIPFQSVRYDGSEQIVKQPE